MSCRDSCAKLAIAAGGTGGNSVPASSSSGNSASKSESASSRCRISGSAMPRMVWRRPPCPRWRCMPRRTISGISNAKPAKGECRVWCVCALALAFAALPARPAASRFTISKALLSSLCRSATPAPCAAIRLRKAAIPKGNGKAAAGRSAIIEHTAPRLTAPNVLSATNAPTAATATDIATSSGTFGLSVVAIKSAISIKMRRCISGSLIASLI